MSFVRLMLTLIGYPIERIGSLGLFLFRPIKRLGLWLLAARFLKQEGRDHGKTD